jgi:hypothetical protein
MEKAGFPTLWESSTRITILGRSTLHKLLLLGVLLPECHDIFLTVGREIVIHYRSLATEYFLNVCWFHLPETEYAEGLRPSLEVLRSLSEPRMLLDRVESYEIYTNIVAHMGSNLILHKLDSGDLDIVLSMYTPFLEASFFLYLTGRLERTRVWAMGEVRIVRFLTLHIVRSWSDTNIKEWFRNRSWPWGPPLEFDLAFRLTTEDRVKVKRLLGS